MKVIITMAGRGQRFRDMGYDCPKYMINAFDKTLFEWSMLSLLDFFGHEFIFIARKEDEPNDFIKDKCKFLGINNFSIILLESTTDGQATTVISAEDFLLETDELLIYNIDTYVVQKSIVSQDVKGDGFIPGFVADGDKWSFIKLDIENKIVAIAEKKPISNIATLGLYYFKSFHLYKQYYELTFKDGKNLVKGEKYIAEVYNTMLTNDLEVFGNVIASDKVWGLGTPNDLDFFLNNYGK